LLLVFQAHDVHDDGRTSGCTSGSGPQGSMPCSGADVRSDDSLVLSVPGPQDDPGNPARLAPSYYRLSGENPGSEAVCSHSSTTFLHRVIFALLEGFLSSRRTPDPGAPGGLGAALARVLARRSSERSIRELIGASFKRRRAMDDASVVRTPHTRPPSVGREPPKVCETSCSRQSKVRNFSCTR
jgi:hypothetical protein